MDEQQNIQENASSSAMPPPPLLQTNQLVEDTPLPTDKRPAAATVIGIILLVLAGIALYSFLLPIFKVGADNSGSVSEIYPAWYSMSNVIAAVITFIVSLTMGIGLLRMMYWARTATVIWLILAFLQKTIFTVLNIIFKTNFAKSQAINSSVEEMARFQAATFLAMVFVFIFFLFFYGLMIFFLSRPAVIAAFKQKRKQECP